MAGHETEVLNLGVGGHHLIEQFARYKEFAARAPATPKTVVIILNPLLIHSFDDAHQNVVVRRGMLFEKDNWRLPLAKTILSSVSAAYSFFGHGVRNVQRRYFSRPDFSLDFYIRLYSKSTRIREPEVTAQFESRMIEFERFVRRQGATPTCVYSPTVGGFLLDKLQKEGRLDGAAFDTQFFRDLARRHCTSAGLQFVDFEPTLQQRYDRGEKLNLDLDAHFNEATSLALGEYLYRSLAGP
jgi:hypothetical protein